MIFNICDGAKEKHGVQKEIPGNKRFWVCIFVLWKFKEFESPSLCLTTFMFIIGTGVEIECPS